MPLRSVGILIGSLLAFLRSSSMIGLSGDWMRSPSIFTTAPSFSAFICLNGTVYLSRVATNYYYCSTRMLSANYRQTHSPFGWSLSADVGELLQFLITSAETVYTRKQRKSCKQIQCNISDARQSVRLCDKYLLSLNNKLRSFSSFSFCGCLFDRLITSSMSGWYFLRSSAVFFATASSLSSIMDSNFYLPKI